jgi:hypothetical protein
MTQVSRPSASEYDPYYEGYVSLVPDAPIFETLAAQSEDFRALLAGLSLDGADYRYAPGKWSVRQLLGHINDAERVFGTRAMCIARGEVADLPGYDQDEYVAGTAIESRTVDSLVREFEFLRAANLEMFSGLSSSDWARAGRANGSSVTVRAIGWVLAGHVSHHMAILRERYREAF